MMGNNFETSAHFNSSLQNLRTKWTKNEFLMVVWVKYTILKKLKIWLERLLNNNRSD